MIVPITALYAGLLLGVFVYLSIRVGSMRGKTGISMLDGGNPDMLLEMRRHGNFIENVPFALVLMALVEMNDGSAVFLHVIGVVLVACRITHPFGLRVDSIRTLSRFIGAAGTFLAIIALGLVALWQGIQGLAG